MRADNYHCFSLSALLSNTMALFSAATEGHASSRVLFEVGRLQGPDARPWSCGQEKKKHYRKRNKRGTQMSRRKTAAHLPRKDYQKADAQQVTKDKYLKPTNFISCTLYEIWDSNSNPVFIPEDSNLYKTLWTSLLFWMSAASSNLRSIAWTSHLSKFFSSTAVEKKKGK